MDNILIFNFALVTIQVIATSICVSSVLRCEKPKCRIVETTEPPKPLNGVNRRPETQINPPHPPKHRQNFAPKDGLTEQERIVMSHLIDAWNEYIKLDVTHPSASKDFSDGIHKCQDQLLFRIVQRDYPEAYPIKR